MVRGVLGVTAASTASGDAGSAAGGVRLTIAGSGFDTDPARMAVSLRASGGSTEVASCVVEASGDGSLICLTGASANPATDAGSTLDVRVATLDEGGAVAETVTLAGGYSLLSLSDSMTLTSIDQPIGFTSGGMTLSSGTNLNDYDTADLPLCCSATPRAPHPTPQAPPSSAALSAPLRQLPRWL